MEWYCQFGPWYSQLWFWRFNGFIRTLGRPDYEWRFPICMTFYCFECVIILSHVYLFLRSSITFMCISPLHCIYHAPSRILAFWLMLSVLCTTINKAYLILSCLILPYLILSHLILSFTLRNHQTVCTTKTKPYWNPWKCINFSFRWVSARKT